MKKTLALFLALVTILSIALVACKSNTPPISSNDADDDVWADRANTSETSTDTSKNQSGSWEVLDATTVYVMADGVNIRDGASKSDKKLGSANIGESFPALETNDDWYKITYNNEEAYISADFVTTDAAEATFVDFEEANYVTLTVDEHSSGQDAYTVNLRTMPALDEIGKTVSRNGTDKDGKADGTFATTGGQLVKIGQNQKGNIWKVKYTPTGSEASKVYYIGKGAFVNFDGVVNDYSSTSGEASRG